MKHLLKSLFVLSAFCYLSSFIAFGQKPTLDIVASKRVITLDDEKPEESTDGKKPDPKKAAELAKKAEEMAARTKVQIKTNFVPNGMTPRSYYWSISGIQGEDWVLLKGTMSKEFSEKVPSVKVSDGDLEIDFKKVGSYYASLTVNYIDEKKLKKNQTLDDLPESEVVIEYESFITVTNNLDELTQLHADSNFVKLVKRASDYSLKPKYANDPTPYIFLAKGLFGIERKQIKDDNIQNPFEEAVAACAVAIERDANGVFQMPIHKMWLNGFQSYILSDFILSGLDNSNDYPVMYNNKDKAKTAESLEELLQYCEYYASVSKNPISIKFVEAAIRYHNKDAKTANLIWKTEVPNLLNIKDKDFENWTEADKNALKVGLILSSQALQTQADVKQDTSRTISYQIINKADKWFEYETDWNAYNLVLNIKNPKR